MTILNLDYICTEKKKINYFYGVLHIEVKHYVVSILPYYYFFLIIFFFCEYVSCCKSFAMYMASVHVFPVALLFYRLIKKGRIIFLKWTAIAQKKTIYKQQFYSFYKA